MGEIWSIILAAGESKRMGVNKLSLPWGKRTVFEHCLHTLLRSKVDEVIVVLNHPAKGIVPLIKDQKVKIVINPYYKRGMSASGERSAAFTWKIYRASTTGIWWTDPPRISSGGTLSAGAARRCPASQNRIPSGNGASPSWRHSIFCARVIAKTRLRLPTYC